MVLREIADEVPRGNIDMAELSRFIATVIPHCLHGGKFREINLNLGTARFPCDAAALLSTYSRYPNLARDTVKSAE